MKKPKPLAIGLLACLFHPGASAPAETVSGVSGVEGGAGFG